MTQTVPGPKKYPVVGTAYTIDPDKLIQSDVALAEKYGGIFLQRFPGHEPVYMISSQRIVNEICDETRFYKKIHAAIRNLRPLGGQGLFTGDTHNEEWQQAHRILMPAFSPTALKAMFESMTDIADQLKLKWSRRRPDQPVDVAEEFTRLTIDTIALTAFSYRLNSFYSETLHPFVNAMVTALVEAARLAHMPGFQKALNKSAVKNYEEAIAEMRSIAQDFIDDRRRNPLPEGEWDILDTMLNAEDPVTGEKLSDESVCNQMVTFLIAGHETTSGLLSFAVYELMRNRSVLRHAQQVVDEVRGGRPPRYDDLKDLGYIDQILRETLRIYPTAPAFGVTPYEKTRIGATDDFEGYEVNPGDTLLTLIPSLHQDPEVWQNPKRFDPERFSPENTPKIPQNSWKPFGNGERSCIGRGFALQEAQLMLTLVLQNFEMDFADPNYELDIRESLSLKPNNLMVRFTQREISKRYSAAPTAAGATTQAASTPTTEPEIAVTGSVAAGSRMQVLYGSEAGTARGFAERIATTAGRIGFETLVSPLNDAVDNLITDGPVIIVTASYEGLPPKNAKEFLDWVRSTEGTSAHEGVNYCVFGVGNSDWGPSFQRVPTQIDQGLAAGGAQRIDDAGAADVRGDFEEDFNGWMTGLWESVGEVLGVDIAVADVEQQRATVVLAEEAPEARLAEGPRAPSAFRTAIVRSNEVMNTGGAGEIGVKRRIAFDLPEGMDYRLGDYLEVVPRNSARQVERALRLLRTAPETRVVVGGENTFLPQGFPLAVGEIFTSHLNLNAPAGSSALRTLAEHCDCPPEKAEIAALAEPDRYHDEVVAKRLTVLDVLDRYRSVSMTAVEAIPLFTELLPRQYSISSAPFENEGTAELTVSEVAGPAWSGVGEYRGTASTYLGSAEPETPVSVAVTPGPEGFRPPEDITVPMVLVGAGSGIAPLRAFLVDLERRAESRDDAARALLFFGTHGRDTDYLYADEYERLTGKGLLDVRPAFSRQPEGDVKYAQDALWRDRDEVWELITSGAKVLVCGDARTLVPGVRETLTEIIREKVGDRQEAERRLHAMETETMTFVTESFT
ncbi:cytochrome P450 [Corynebacterium bovis]|uniref:cytochrome P450 n=1 Tax=Corynebacterium bovis TaxID=36808 RepID=UPI000F645B70|nr:cytochrome P450 [Corynebacterium bovis]